MRVEHGFVSDGDDLAAHELFGELAGGGQVQVTEQHQPCMHQRDFRRLRLLDLDHHVAGIDLLRRGGDGRARFCIQRIGKTDGGAGMGLDDEFVACGAQRPHALRRDADAEFVVFDFPGDADTHGYS